MDDKKKKYIVPNADITEFPAEDIIVTSLTKDENDADFNDGEEW